ncbi:hypothetical protein AAC978_10030 [Desulfitobacterium sp. THU1]|uniref:DUF6954 family protein n=1 Tax=Desulfitobacterium sp. THU1 TaxID=3138072 RepID=UPI00311E20E7
MKKVFWYLIAFLLGILPGFFIVFNSVFSDPSGNISERLVTYLLVIVSFGVLGFLLGRTRENPWMMGTMLSLFSIIILVFYLFKEPGSLLLILSYLVLTFVSSYLGAKLGVPKAKG